MCLVGTQAKVKEVELLNHLPMEIQLGESYLTDYLRDCKDF
jgi:hypothetical protein